MKNQANHSDLATVLINPPERPIERPPDEPRTAPGLRSLTAAVVILVPRGVGQQMLIQHETGADARRLGRLTRVSLHGSTGVAFEVPRDGGGLLL